MKANQAHRIFANAAPILALVAALTLTTATQAQTPEPAAAAEVQIEPKAQAILDKVAKLYDNAKGATVQLNSVSRVTIQGQPREQNSEIDVVIERPNKASLNIDSGRGGIINTDGQTMSVYVPPTNRWVAMDAPADIEALMQTEVLNGMAPMANSVLNLFTGDMEASLLSGAESVSYVGQEQLDGEAVHHLLFKQQPVDVHVYVRDGEQPAVLRVAPDSEQYLQAIREQSPNSPVSAIEIQFNYSNWAFSEDIDDKAFAFTPPQGVPKAESMMAALGVEPNDPRALKGQQAPNFELPRLEGGAMTLNDHEGEKVVVLDFWATWCGPCVRAMPGLNELATELGDDVVVYAVNLRETGDKINPFMEKHGLDALKVLLDAQGEVAQMYNVRGIPQTVVVDKKGVIRAVHVGFSPSLKQELMKEIKPLLGDDAG